MIDWTSIVIVFVEILVVVGALLGGVSIMTWVERRLSGVIQFRRGPNRVGPFGLFQPIADGVKFFMKEEIIPADAYMSIYVLAPGLALTTSVFAFSVIPYGPTIELFGRQSRLCRVGGAGGFRLWAHGLSSAW